MKKSLLVVPALGVMLLAAAGSVGGTVAWFSSVSSVSIETSKFEVTRLDGNLGLTMTAGRGTTVNDTTKTVTVSGKQTHASFDHTSGDLSTISSETKSKLRKVGDLSTTEGTGQYTDEKWKARAGTTSAEDIWWAVSWEMKFTYSFAAEGKIDLYFDPTSTIAKVGSEADESIKGFRVALVAAGKGNTGSAQKSIVWAPARDDKKTGENYDQADYKQPKYITSSDIVAETNKSTYDECGGAYTLNDNLFIKGYKDVAKIPEGTRVTTHDVSKGYLGTMVKDGTATNNYLTYTVVAWFEGTDPSISPDQSVMNKLTATLAFYTREYTGNN